jgi:D-serine deaminase-like pyridoxal phosphate-dependent protein
VMTDVEPGMAVAAVPTPALIVDIGRMERNIAAWQAMADRNGTGLRPHIKTHKSPAIAAMQLAAGACGIAAAKPTEAEVFVDAGCTDVVIAYPTVGRDKWERVARMATRARMAVNVDSDAQARGLSAAAVAEGVVIRAHIEIDTGLHRVGLSPDDHAGIAAFAGLLTELPGLELEGVTTHRGKFSERLARMSNADAGREEGRIMVDVAERLRADGFPIAQVSAGGTITGPGVAEVPGVTEVRAGTYVFFDAMQVGYGAATPADVALCVLATVVSTRRAGWTTVDAGTKTFSGDRGGVASRGDEIARAVDVDAAVMRTTEEHGMVRLGEGVSVEVGQKLRFTPYHVCTSVNLADALVGVRDDVVEAVWPIAARGKTR